MTTVVVVVADGLGVGGAPDAERFDSVGANTAGAALAAADRLGLVTPNLDRLGLRALVEPHSGDPEGAAWALVEHSGGCDTPTGHWELMGVTTPIAPPTYPDGFDAELLDELAAACGVEGWLTNGPISGLVVLERCGAEHVTSGLPIVYTSADSVLQIAAHEDHFGLERLLDVCAAARRVLDRRAAAAGTSAIGRVIARPFVGTDGKWARTANRRDWPVPPPSATALDLAAAAGVRVTGIGKIGDIFDHRGLSRELHPRADGPGIDAACLDATVSEMGAGGLVFTNLVAFDTLYGHPRDVDGYARHLAWFDAAIAAVCDALHDGDRLVITADHGNDPTARGNDHTRERVPGLVWGPDLACRGRRGTAPMAALGAAVLTHLGVDPAPLGVAPAMDLH
jgi:phosphopentomutase